MITRCLEPLAAPNSRRPKCPAQNRTKYAYDAAGRTSSIHDEQSDGTAICSFAFTRDDNGNILTSLREDDSCWYYAYDGLQRLTEAQWKDSTGTSLYAFEYDYDKVGNRTHLLFNGVDTYYTYNEANELTVEEELGGDTVYYVYDGRGNQTERSVLGGETLYFDYNSRNLITRIDSTEGGFTPNTFDYNALGQRISKADSDGLTYYVWDGLNITHEHDGSGTVTRRYTHGHTPIHGVFSLIDVEDSSNNHYFYHLDQVGGVHRLTDASETTDTTYEFSPFGRILEETAGNATNDFVFPATYMGLRDVPDLGLSPVRLYDALGGRYAGRDSSAESSSYHALGGSPRLEVDPSGLKVYGDLKPRRLKPGEAVLNPVTGRPFDPLTLGNTAILLPTAKDSRTTMKILDFPLFRIKKCGGHQDRWFVGPLGKPGWPLDMMGGKVDIHIRSEVVDIGNPHVKAETSRYNSEVAEHNLYVERATQPQRIDYFQAHNQHLAKRKALKESEWYEQVLVRHEQDRIDEWVRLHDRIHWLIGVWRKEHKGVCLCCGKVFLKAYRLTLELWRNEAELNQSRISLRDHSIAFPYQKRRQSIQRNLAELRTTKGEQREAVRAARECAVKHKERWSQH